MGQIARNGQISITDSLVLRKCFLSPFLLPEVDSHAAL